MDFEDFRRVVSKTIDIDLESYKEKQLKRRIEHLMFSQGFKNFSEYSKVLRTDPKQRELFLDKLTINVSEFFRNKSIFDTLEREILPKLLEKKRSLKVWSAACSNGAEPYSLAIILDELTPGVRHTIDATDIDVKMLNEAREGCYKKDLVKNVTRERLQKYFTQNGDNFCIKPEIKKRVNFKEQDLLKNFFKKDYDLIVCRNVTIYFTREAQNELYKKFLNSLSPEGILFIGATESILNYKELGFKKISPWFYSKS